jgi:hypothetical protein
MKEMHKGKLYICYKEACQMVRSREPTGVLIPVV